MDDAAQVRVLHAGADLREQREPLSNAQASFIAVCVIAMPGTYSIAK